MTRLTVNPAELAAWNARNRVAIEANRNRARYERWLEALYAAADRRFGG